MAQELRSETKQMAVLRAAMESVSRAYPMYPDDRMAEPGPAASSPWPSAGVACVYFMVCAASGHVKIGFTRDLKYRFSRFGSVSV